MLKKNWTLAVAVIAVFSLIAAACGGTATTTTTTAAPATTQATTTTTAATTTTEAAPAATLLIWADDTRTPVVQAAAEQFTKDTGVEVQVELVGFGDIRDNVKNAAPAGEGPDLFIGAHDWTGELAQAGVVAPIDLQGREGDFFPVAIDAFSYNGELYGLPYAIEAIGLIYNKDLVPEPPTTFAELRQDCADLGLPNDEVPACLGLPAGDAYHNFPFLSAFGGYIFKFEGGKYDPTDVGLDNPGAIQGAEFLDKLFRDGITSGTVDYGTMADLFNQGKIPFMWTGPWQITSVKDAGINYGVTKLPLMEGNTPHPFVGVQGFFLNAFSENTVLAQTFLLDYIATTDTMVKLYEVGDRPPALISAYDEVSSNPDVQAFGASAADGFPMPNIPEMSSVWGALGDAVSVIANGNYGEEVTTDSGETVKKPASAAEAMKAAAEQVRTAISGS